MSEILTVKEVAELLKTSRVQVRKMIQSGELPYIGFPLKQLSFSLQTIYDNAFLSGAGTSD